MTHFSNLLPFFSEQRRRHTFEPPQSQPPAEPPRRNHSVHENITSRPRPNTLNRAATIEGSGAISRSRPIVATQPQSLTLLPPPKHSKPEGTVDKIYTPIFSFFRKRVINIQFFYKNFTKFFKTFF